MHNFTSCSLPMILSRARENGGLFTKPSFSSATQHSACLHWTDVLALPDCAAPCQLHVSWVASFLPLNSSLHTIPLYNLTVKFCTCMCTFLCYNTLSTLVDRLVLMRDSRPVLLAILFPRLFPDFKDETICSNIG